jgi:molecular chaperone Hsp33
MSGVDVVRRFVVEDRAVRGQIVRLARSWIDLREHAQYPLPVRDLLGEALGAAVLLAATLKFDGTLTLQLQGDGAVRLLVAQCSSDFRVRGIARFDAEKTAADFASLAGAASTLTVTIEARDRGARYQGIVPINGDTLGRCLESYFASSEQLPTAVRLHADAHGVAGLLIQRLPLAGGQPVAAGELAQATWDDAHRALMRLPREALLASPAEDLLRGCLPDHDLRLFAGRTVRFECGCDRDRVGNMLRSLGRAENRDILAEQGAVTVTCEFCHRPYRFDAIDVEELFASGTAPGSASLN